MKRTPIKIKSKHSQVHISKVIGVTQPTVSGWLNLKFKPVGLARDAMETNFPDLLKRIDDGFEKEGSTSTES